MADEVERFGGDGQLERARVAELGYLLDEQRLDRLVARRRADVEHGARHRLELGRHLHVRRPVLVERSRVVAQYLRRVQRQADRVL